MSETDSISVPPHSTPLLMDNGIGQWRAEFTTITVEATRDGGKLVRLTVDGTSAFLNLNAESARHLAALLVDVTAHK